MNGEVPKLCSADSSNDATTYRREEIIFVFSGSITLPNTEVFQWIAAIILVVVDLKYNIHIHLSYE